MSNTTKNQYYRYTLRSVAQYNGAMCYKRVLLYPAPPEEALELVGLKTRIYLEFGAHISAANRKITKIGVTNEYLSTNLVIPDEHKEFEVNWSADGNRIIDKTIDLTSLAYKNNVGYYDILNISGNDDINLMYFELPFDISSNTDAVLKLWKADTLWTTTGIR